MFIPLSFFALSSPASCGVCCLFTIHVPPFLFFVASMVARRRVFIRGGENVGGSRLEVGPRRVSLVPSTARVEEFNLSVRPRACDTLNGYRWTREARFAKIVLIDFHDKRRLGTLAPPPHTPHPLR